MNNFFNWIIKVKLKYTVFDTLQVVDCFKVKSDVAYYIQSLHTKLLM